MKRATISILVFGTFMTFIPFLSSLKPNATADANLPRIDLSEIKHGEYVIRPHPLYGRSSQGFVFSVLIYKSDSGDVRVWNIPTKDGAVYMPDIHWWRPSLYRCKQFGPSKVNGVVDESLPIQCHDADLPSEWWAKNWRWDIYGKNLGKNVSDLESSKGVIQGEYFVFAKQS